MQCQSLQPIPKELVLDSTENFAVDVIKRHGQKILLTREKLSQATWLDLIPDQTTATFRKVLLKTIPPWTCSEGATVRCEQWHSHC